MVSGGHECLYYQNACLIITCVTFVFVISLFTDGGIWYTGIVKKKKKKVSVKFLIKYKIKNGMNFLFLVFKSNLAFSRVRHR